MAAADSGNPDISLLLINGTQVYAMRDSEGAIKVPCGKYDKRQHRTAFVPAIRDLFEKTGQFIFDGSYGHFEHGSAQVFYLHLDSAKAEALRVGKPDNEAHSETLWVGWRAALGEIACPRIARALGFESGGPQIEI